jgi:hypothetical protein
VTEDWAMAALDTAKTAKATSVFFMKYSWWVTKNLT